jgi:hypothetical protein
MINLFSEEIFNTKVHKVVTEPVIHMIESCACI